jgi:hypothetical protein
MSIVLFNATPKQEQFIDATFSGQYRQLLYGGAIRGGKSFVLVALIFMLCKIYPKSRWAITRKDLPTLRRNTLPIFEKLRPSTFCGPFNQSTWTAQCTNGSEILLFPESATHDPELNRWRGLEVNGFALEEMNELKFKTFNKAIERAGSWQLPRNHDSPPPLILGSCNPSENWVKDEFYDPWEAGELEPPRFYLPATIHDNPHLPEEYLESLKSLPEAEYQMFVEGNWRVSLDPMQLIQWTWINAAQKDVEPELGEQKLGGDIGQYGADPSVFIHFSGFSLVGIYHYPGLSTTESALKFAEVMHDNSILPERALVDNVGLGAGTVDALHGMDIPVRPFNSGSTHPMYTKPQGSFFRFKNARSWAWWNARELLRLGRIHIPEKLARAHPQLVRDLTAPRYRIHGKEIEVEPKVGNNVWGIKARLGRSTNYGDAFVYALAKALPRGKRPAIPPTISTVSQPL